MPDNIERELEKIKFHIRLIGETIDHRSYPIPFLVIEMDWDDKDLDTAHDIFEKYDNKLEREEKVNWQEFETELRKTFGIGNQIVKSIVLAFYRNHQWTRVCAGYAKAHECIEFHEIIRSENA
jgi:hypothetical protein